MLEKIKNELSNEVKIDNNQWYINKEGSDKMIDNSLK